MAKKITTSKTGKKLIAGIVATTIIAGAGVAGGMAIQNAYADPNAGGDITRLETDLTTEKANHEATKAELAEVKAELESEKAQAVQDEAKITELEARVAELEQQLTRDESKLYLDEFYSQVPDTRLVYLDEDYSFIFAIGYGGAYLMTNSDYVMTRVSVNAYNIGGFASTDNYVLINNMVAGSPSFVYDKSTQTLSEQVFDFDILNVQSMSNDMVLLSSYNETDGDIEILWDLKTNTEVSRLDMRVEYVLHIENDLYLIRNSWANYFVLNTSTGDITLAQSSEYDGTTEDTAWLFEFNRIDTNTKIISFITQNMQTGVTKGYEFNYETMTGADVEVRTITLVVYNKAGEQSQVLENYMIGTPTIESYFLNNPNLGTTSASQFSKFAVRDADTGELVEVGTDFVLDETVTELHIYW